MSNSYQALEIASRYESCETVPLFTAQTDTGEARAHRPVYDQVLTWLLMWPLLNMTAKGSISFLNSDASAFYYQNAYLAKTAQNIRPQVVVEVVLLTGFAIFGSRKIWRVLANNRIIVLALV